MTEVEPAGAPEVERARLFVALALPGTVRDALHRWARGELAAIEDMRLVEPANLHVTLCFLGSRPVGEIEAITARCRRAAGAAAPSEIPLTVGGATWLPPRRPRVLAVALTDEARRLAALQAELSASLSAGGFYAPEDRPFLAHVTVARVVRRARLRPVELAPPAPARFAPPALVLYRSRTRARGASYEPLETVALPGGGGGGGP